MSNLSRKDFIKLSSWGIVAALIPVQKINAVTSYINSKTSYDLPLALAHAKTAKELFYKKKYKLAEDSYLMAIAQAPNIIQFYDGLDNVYGAQNKSLDSVLLFKLALEKNPKLVAFYDRAARSLMRLELGNNLKASQYKTSTGSVSLLGDAKKLYQAAQTQDSSKVYLTKGLNKVNYKLSVNAKAGDHRKDATSKQKKKANKVAFKAVYNKQLANKSNKQILDLINSQIDAKKRTPLFHADEIEYRKKNIVKLKKFYYNELLKRESTPKSDRLGLATMLYEVDKKDSQSYKMLKNEYYSVQKFADFAPIAVERAKQGLSVYSHLGAIEAISFAVQKKQLNIQELSNALAISEQLLTKWPLMLNIRAKVVNKQAKTYIEMGMSDKARITLDAFFKILLEPDSDLKNLDVNDLIFTYADSFITNGQDYKTAETLLLIGTLEYDKDKESGYKNLELISNKKANETFKEKRILYYALHNVYMKMGAIKNADIVFKKLLQFDPNDKFLLKRM